jgi:hypothetical protein
MTLIFIKFVKSITMTTTQIKQLLHNYIDTAEDKKLKAIYTLLQDDIDEEYKFSKKQKTELDRRLNDYQNGIGRTFSWDETVAMTDKALVDRQK